MQFSIQEGSFPILVVSAKKLLLKNETADEC
jgi:hypothetical protein